MNVFNRSTNRVVRSGLFDACRTSQRILVHGFRTDVTKLKREEYSFTKEETARYSAQLLCPGFGRDAQLRLKNSSILVVGAGGIGSSALQFLTVAGVGRIGIIDSQKVNSNILLRQVLHSERSLGKSIVSSAKYRLSELNSNVEFTPHQMRLTRENALKTMESYDVIVDATDTPMAKYIINDVCVLLKKPMVTAAALRYEGHVTVYNYNQNSPCYRCVFPKSIPAAMFPKIADSGVLGPLPGIIGNIQAIEAVKIAAGLEPAYDGVVLTYNSFTGKFDQIEVQKRRDDCESCGTNSTLTRNLIDYNEFCSVKPPQPVKILKPEERITVQEYQEVLTKGQPHLLIDVRPMIQQKIVKLNNAVSIPLEEILKGSGVEQVSDHLARLTKSSPDVEVPVFVMCRRGNASQRAARELLNRLADDVTVKDIIGGIESWSEEIDKEMPMY